MMRSVATGVELLLVASTYFSRSSAHPVKGITLKEPGTNGAVASESAICSQIGIDLLKRGGNAADAYVGTNFCVGVTGMYHSGIGGGGFMLVRTKCGAYETIDYRETAPAAAFEDMFVNNSAASVHGGLSVGVPGELRGLEYLHKKYGALTWEAVVTPSAHLARDGFKVNEDLVRYIASASADGNDFLSSDPLWAVDFAPNGTVLGLGDHITRKRYAKTLEKIAKHGVEDFYTGELAQEIIDTIQKTNGTMTLEDLKNYTVLIKEPLSIDFRGHKITTTVAPSSGPVTLSILKTMEQYDPADYKDVNLTTHRLDEAFRFAYGERQQLGDPDFVEDLNTFQVQMASEDKARYNREHIYDDRTQEPEAYVSAAEYTTPSHGTSHIVVTDRRGMTISSTTTINLLFGSQVMTAKSGIILNDEMNDFSIPGVTNEFGFEPSEANFIRPGKRPLSSITPVIVEHPDGSFYLATGAAGGSRIITSTAQTVYRILEGGASLHDAIERPRIHDQLFPNNAAFEWAYDNSTVAALAAKGHNVTWAAPTGSSVQGILVLDNGTFIAQGETRQKNSGGYTV